MRRYVRMQKPGASGFNFAPWARAPLTGDNRLGERHMIACPISIGSPCLYSLTAMPNSTLIHLSRHICTALGHKGLATPFCVSGLLTTRVAGASSPNDACLGDKDMKTVLAALATFASLSMSVSADAAAIITFDGKTPIHQSNDFRSQLSNLGLTKYDTTGASIFLTENSVITFHLLARKAALTTAFLRSRPEPDEGGIEPLSE